MKLASESRSSFPHYRSLSSSSQLFSAATVVKNGFFCSIQTSKKEKSASSMIVRKQEMLLISRLSFFWVGNGAMVKSSKAKYNNNPAMPVTEDVNQRL